tara:strand:- start:451 stop:705 length:255 start_codon:yes stop_codon:yes gene_type:complete
MEDILRGESVQPTVDYDLFGTNVNGCRGIYLKMDETTNKMLIYFPVNQEWGELPLEDVLRLSPGKVPEDNSNFVKNIKTLEYTY